MRETVLDVRGLSVVFPTLDGDVRAVSDLSYTLHRGETLGIVGESGSGKSVSSLALMGLLNRDRARIDGQALLSGRDLLSLPPDEMRDIRGKDIAMIFQDPFACLHPMHRVGDQIAEAVTAHKKVSKSEANKRAVELLQAVGIPNAKDRARDYPHQFSGGMRQRAMIAMALVHNPSVLIADEPTTALDVTVQAQILQLIERQQRDRGVAVILISHDLGVVAGFCDRVIVMYAGKVVESAKTQTVFREPRHPYTRALQLSRPALQRKGAELYTIPGLPPDLSKSLPCCAFAPRCEFALGDCTRSEMRLESIAGDHASACVRVQRGELSLHK